jgi:putative oxidoreductase
MSPPCVWSTSLQRTFTSFPSGPVGAALLMLRVIVGGIVILEALLAVVGGHSLMTIVAAFIAALTGIALMLGFLMPIVSTAVAAVGVAMLLGLHGPILRLLDSSMALFEFVAIAAALAVLGPGAVSIDARLFGRREVTISEEHRPTDL